MENRNVNMAPRRQLQVRPRLAAPGPPAGRNPSAVQPFYKGRMLHLSGRFDRKAVMEKAFSKIASKVAHASGKPITFVACCLIIAVWAVTGPLFGFSDTWQLVINT